MSSRREYELLFQLNAQLGGSYTSTFNSAQKSIVAMQKEIEALSKRQSDISSYQKQQAALEANKRKLEVLQQQYDNIQHEMNETGQSSADLQNKLLAKQMQIDKTSASINAQTAKLAEMGNALRAAGVNTDDLTKESAELGRQIDELKAKQEEAAEGAEDFGRAGVQAFGALQQAIASAGVARALGEIYELLWNCADASMAFESTMTGVAKTTDLSDDEFAAMSKSIKEMATEIPETTDELGQIAETAGQLGIVKGSLLDFTEIMAMLGTATNMTSSEAATMLAQFASITNMDPSYYMNLGSSVVALGNKYATTERNIADMSQSIAAAAAIANMSEADIVGISAAVTSLGITAQNGGTQMTKLISEINSAVSSGEGLEAWARAARMEAEEFAEAWRDDAAGALDMFIRGLNATYEAGGDVYSVLADLGITETRMVTMITSLVKSGDRLTSTLNTANTAWRENTALTTEAEKRYATTQSQLTLLQNAYNNLRIAVGDNYNPTLRELYALGTQVLDGMTEFVEQNPALVKAITAGVGILFTAVGALAAYTLAVKVATAFSTAFASAAGVALGPIIAVVAGVAALTALFVGLNEAMQPTLDESWELTAASRAQYNELQNLNEEYEKTVEMYGETSYEAQQLQWQIEDLNAEYENGKQTLDEYRAAHQELMDSYADMESTHEESYGEIEKEQRSIVALIGKLEELTATTDSAKENQQAILAIIEALNDSVPDLALSYDDVIKNSGDIIKVLENTAKAQYAQKLLKEQWSEYVDRAGTQDSFKTDLVFAYQNWKIAKGEFDLANQAYNAAKKRYDYFFDKSAGLAKFMGTQEEAAAYDAAKEHLQTYTWTLAMAAAKYSENKVALAELESVFKDYQAAQEELAESGENISEVISDVTDRVADLAAKYEEAYNAALSSVQGQYSLWDEADKIVATSAESINANLDSQISHWQNYNANLASLADRTDDIDGLREMIASFADGSKESVNAIAGMAAASDEDLKAMVQKWKTLQQEQDTTANSLAEFENDFATSMDALQQELETTIGEMNLSEEAAQSARYTIQGFIDSAEDMTDEVYYAYYKLGQTAVRAFNRVAGTNLTLNVPSRGYASGTRSASPGWAWVGEEGPELMYMQGGEAIIPSDISLAAYAKEMRFATLFGKMSGFMTEAIAPREAQLISLYPRLMTLPSITANRTEAISAAIGGRGGFGGITIKSEFNVTVGSGADVNELREAFSKINNDIGEIIVEKIEDYFEDKSRKSYT
jgi:TP901 family phage tail tape measure protein